MDAPLREDYRPRWVWATVLLLLPLLLTSLGFVGVWPQPIISLRVASYAPRLAVAISLCGMAAALIIRRRQPVLGVAFAGLAVSLTGYLVLLWAQGD
jgi:hypothetical protein